MTSVWYCLGVFLGCGRTWGLWQKKMLKPQFLMLNSLWIPRFLTNTSGEEGEYDLWRSGCEEPLVVWVFPLSKWWLKPKLYVNVYQRGSIVKIIQVKVLYSDLYIDGHVVFETVWSSHLFWILIWKCVKTYDAIFGWMNIHESHLF